MKRHSHILDVNLLTIKAYKRNLRPVSIKCKPSILCVITLIRSNQQCRIAFLLLRVCVETKLNYISSIHDWHCIYFICESYLAHLNAILRKYGSLHKINWYRWCSAVIVNQENTFSQTDLKLSSHQLAQIFIFFALMMPSIRLLEFWCDLVLARIDEIGT